MRISRAPYPFRRATRSRQQVPKTVDGGPRMIGKALTRKVAATAIAAFMCGGAAWAAAATLPAGGGSRVQASADESTTGVDESTTTGDLETTTTGDLETTTTGDLETTTTADLETTTPFGGTTTPVPCNHGHDVSEVAHNTPPGPGHGAAVSEAAHKKCDKGDHEGDDQDGDDQGENEDGDHGPPAKPGHQGVEHSHGHGHGGDGQSDGEGDDD